VSLPLAFFSRTEGYAWALVSPSRCDVVLFVLKETIWWVRVSTPARCSPRCLGGMSYPFKGFESSEWTRLGKTRCCARVAVVVTLHVPVRGEVNGAKPALSHGFLVVFKWTVCHLQETVRLPEAWCETNTAPSGDE
jgi:hypothetical protein